MIAQAPTNDGPITARSGAPPVPWALGAAATAGLSAALLVAIVAVFSCASTGCF